MSQEETNAWKLLDKQELSANNRYLEVSGLTKHNNLKVVILCTRNASQIRNDIYFDDVNSGSKYNRKRRTDNTVSGSTNENSIDVRGDESSDRYIVLEILNWDGEEKIVWGEMINSASNASGTVNTIQFGAKYVNKTGQIQKITCDSGTSNGFGVGSFMTVYGSVPNEITDEKTTLTNVPIGTQYRETDTRKIYRNTIPFKDNCIAYYNFDSTSGGLVNQATTANGFTSGLGSAADGTISGATLDTTNKKLGSGCYNFDGSNDKVQTSDCSALNGATAFSISLWKNNSSTPSKSEAFINIGSDNTNNQFRMIVGGNYTTIEMWLNAVESSSKISVDCDGNGWIHYVVVWDSTQTGDSNKFKLYKNGSAQSLSFQGSNNAGDSAIQTISGGTPIIIGSLASAGVEYDGLIDDLGIWNKALSSDEISDLYNSGTGKTVDTITWKERGTA